MGTNQGWSGEIQAREERWESRPIAAAALRALVISAPIAASVLSGIAFVRVAPQPTMPSARLGWWVAMFVLSSLILWITDRFARRLLPLAVLLRMAMAFPDRAPSRYAIARKVSTRDLEKRVERARRTGLATEPARAAATVLGLVASLSLHDRRTRGHAERVRVYTDLIAEQYQLTTAQRDRLRWAALLHDIGKLTVPTSILNKAGKPTAAEWTRLRKHPAAGAAFIAPLETWLGEWARAIPEHHEQWDGSGYPAGLSGEQISLAARIVAVADAYEVMTTARVYSKPISPAAARQELARCAGTQFDPAVVRAFLNISLGRLRLVAGPISWVLQLPFVPQYQPLIPLNASLPATVAQVTAAGAVAVSPVADIPQRAVEARIAAEEVAAAADSDAAGHTADPARGEGKAKGHENGEAQGEAKGHDQDRDAKNAKSDKAKEDGDRGRANGHDKDKAQGEAKGHDKQRPARGDANGRREQGARGQSGADGPSGMRPSAGARGPSASSGKASAGADDGSGGGQDNRPEDAGRGDATTPAGDHTPNTTTTTREPRGGATDTTQPPPQPPAAPPRPEPQPPKAEKPVAAPDPAPAAPADAGGPPANAGGAKSPKAL